MTPIPAFSGKRGCPRAAPASWPPQTLTAGPGARGVEGPGGAARALLLHRQHFGQGPSPHLIYQGATAHRPPTRAGRDDHGDRRWPVIMSLEGTSPTRSPARAVFLRHARDGAQPPVGEVPEHDQVRPAPGSRGMAGRHSRSSPCCGRCPRASARSSRSTIDGVPAAVETARCSASTLRQSGSNLMKARRSAASTTAPSQRRGPRDWRASTRPGARRGLAGRPPPRPLRRPEPVPRNPIRGGRPPCSGRARGACSAPSTRPGHPGRPGRHPAATGRSSPARPAMWAARNSRSHRGCRPRSTCGPPPKPCHTGSHPQRPRSVLGTAMPRHSPLDTRQRRPAPTSSAASTLPATSTDPPTHPGLDLGQLWPRPRPRPRP